MKNIIIVLFFCINYQMLLSQNNSLVIKNNTELNYVCKLHGQTRTLKLLTQITNDTLVLDVETRGVKTKIIIKQEALKNGNTLSFNQGENTTVLALKVNETFFMISQATYQDLLKNNSFIYNNTTYDFKKESTILVDAKSIETLHVKAQIDETEMWIVKNASFPLIYKLDKNPLGINYTLVKVVEK